LHTPKRYRVGKRPKRYLFTLKYLWLWLLTPLVVVAGVWLMDRRDQVVPEVNRLLNSAIQSAGDTVSTAIAPTATPIADPAEMIARGDSAWGRGAVEEAVDAYAEALPGAPNDIRVHYLYTFGLVMEGRDDEALIAAENAVTANPFASDAWAILAWAQTRAGEPNAAVASAMQALALNPQSARAMAFMAEAYLDANQPGRAEEMARRAVEADPDSFEAYYISALINWNANFDFQAAYADFEAALERAPNLPYIAIDMAWLEWNLQSYDNGLVLLEEVIDRNPNNLDALFALGFYYYSVYGDPNRAEDYLTRCITVDTDNRSCLNYLGTVQTGTGNLTAAIETFQRLIDTGTQDPRHFLAAARAYDGLGDCRRALPLLRTGYGLEQRADDPNADRLAAFESLLNDCGAPAGSASASAPSDGQPEATAEAGGQ
jgi:tetratricopeptide (TPR) repeat protein